MAGPIILVANPGSASRKYALYEDVAERGALHFEWVWGKLACTLRHHGEQHAVHLNTDDLGSAAKQMSDIFRQQGLLKDEESIAKIGLRVVAPSSYFLEDHIVNQEFMERLEAARPRAPIHVAATLEELQVLRADFQGVPIVGVSDSAFHSSKPDYAWNYGISLEVADHFEIKRFGYHGLSAASVVQELQSIDKLPHKLIVCHLGSGASVTAVRNGHSLDNTMGYSPLEGLVMSTRSGSIDPTAVRVLKDVCHFDEDGIEDYLNNRSGLLGLGGSSDIRELLRREEDGDQRSHLALETYIYSVQKAIGQLTATLGGADAIAFTGTVGERSAPIRARILKPFHYLDFILDDAANEACQTPEKPTIISRLAHSKPLFVSPTREAAQIAQRIHRMVL